MSTSTLAYQVRRSPIVARLSDYLELTKPKIALLELACVTAAALLAGFQPWLLLHALVGVGLVAASASALNQWLERGLDLRMQRTADRPLPSGRLGAWEVLLFGCATGILGVAYLLLAVNPLTAMIGLTSWVLYVAVYTPLKSRTTANTMVGAVAGALPVLMGWTAMGQPVDLRAATLFLIVFLWQFPHFMAIAWIYREQYAAAGMKMLPVVEPSGVRSGAQAVIAALVLLPVSLVPAVSPLAINWHPWEAYFFVASALLLGIGHLGCAVLFMFRLDEPAARRLLRASLVYLPLLLVSLMLIV